MKTKLITTIMLTLFLGGMLIASATAQPMKPIRCELLLKKPSVVIEDFGGLPDASRSQLNAINDRGQVVGYSVIAGLSHAFLWTTKDGMIDLGTLPGGSTSAANAINDRGQVVGWSGVVGASHAVLWITRHNWEHCPWH